MMNLNCKIRTNLENVFKFKHFKSLLQEKAVNMAIEGNVLSRLTCVVFYTYFVNLVQFTYKVSRIRSQISVELDHHVMLDIGIR